jgi:arabinofuranosyltransferase
MLAKHEVDSGCAAAVSFRGLRLEMPPALRSTVSQHWWLALLFGPILALGVVYATAHYFICDDAFISFRYARNFALGEGLVFNHGERVEGYTDFLWVIELGALLKLFHVPLPLGSVVLSSLYSFGTLWVVTLFARQTPLRRYLVPVVAAAWLLLLLNRNFATWTSSGLETRQFTFFAVLGVYLHGRTKRGLYRFTPAALCWAAAELTRPEGTLLFACGGFYLLWQASREPKLRWVELVGFVVPFVAIVGAHILFRVVYYGDILPNTYYAKHVRPWPEAGMAFITSAIIEGGLYLLVPIAALGAIARTIGGRDDRHWLSALCIVPHAAYLVDIGGDHFEYRMLDFWWPLLAVAAADGVFTIATVARGLAERVTGVHAASFAQFIAGSTLVCVLLYSTMLQFAQFCLTYDKRGRMETLGLNAPVTVSSFPAAFLLPGMTELTIPYRAAQDYTSKHSVGLRWPEHRNFWHQQATAFAAYEPYTERLFPSDAVMAYATIGVASFSLGNLTIVDEHGLTDRVIAHNNTTTDNKYRQLAHDRHPPPGYLRERGVNLNVLPSQSRMLATQRYALRLRDDLWMPLVSEQPDWLERAFRTRGLWFQKLDQQLNRNSVMIDGRVLQPVRELGFFDSGDLQDWQPADGNGLRDVAREPRSGQTKIVGQVGAGLLNSFDAIAHDAQTGSVTSPEFRPERGWFLTFLVGGGSDPNVGVELVASDKVVASWHGADTETLSFVATDLSAYAGAPCRVRAFDRSSGVWAHVIADHFMLMH